ncbi:uncharacterized protein LOC143184527 isoform X2 [Calliopsis andreniformis]|uniref:uncharacterized protein LOC143184527 isoform X2 n=1 Tax=Calliopsis andreniformis TaxID=337506 RepID=UPI003FCCE0F3
MEVDDVNLLVQDIKETNKIPKEELQHEIETRAGSRPPTHQEIKKFEKFSAIKKGCFHPSEDQIISNNWKSFCKLHNWDSRKVQPFLLLREENVAYIRSKIQRRRFVQFLADGLPNRTLYSVYHRFRNLYQERLQRRFLPEEDKMILNHLERNINLDEKRKYADLAKVLKRSRASIWRRYMLLKKKRQ